jgi:polar amino acid transport system permease protein
LIAKKARFRLLDVLLIVLCAGVVIYLGYRIQVRLKYSWNWQVIPRYLLRVDAQTKRLVANYLLLGLFTTIKLSIWSTILAVVIGVVMGIFRTSKRLLARMVGTAYVELVRNLPALVLVFIFYFFVSDQIMPLLGIDNFIRARTGGSRQVLEFLFAPTSLFTQFISGIVTIAVFEGAFITEIVRAGIESIERGQREAAYALGLSWADQMRYVILPQATRRVLPPLANQFVSTIKDSSIVSAISIQELTFEGVQLSTSTQLIFEVWITVTAMYLLLTLSLSIAVHRLEKRLRRSD